MSGCLHMHIPAGYYPWKDSDVDVESLEGHSGMVDKSINIIGGEVTVDVPVNEWFLLKSYLVSTAQLDYDGSLTNDQDLTSDFYYTLFLNSLQAGGLTLYSTDVDLFGIPNLQPGTFGENPIPIPGAVWLLGSGFIGIVGFRRKFKK